MYIITGGAGFIGSCLLSYLNKKGIEDVIIVDNLRSGEKWKNLVGKSYLDFIHKDEFLELLYTGILDNVDGIIHLGACSATTEKDADYLMDNNYHYTRELAEWSLEQNVRFIYASSAATYGDGSLGYDDSDEKALLLRPLNMYGYSKQLMDEWVIRNNLQDNFAGLKFFNVYGPNEYHKEGMTSVVFKAFHQINDTGKVKLFKSDHPDYEDGKQLRDFVYVKDCVDFVWWLLENKDKNGIFNLGTGNARSWVDLVNASFKAMKIEPKIDFIDMPENLKGKYQNYTCANIEKLRKAGYDKPFTSLEDGVKDYICNYLSNNIPYF